MRINQACTAAAVAAIVLSVGSNAHAALVASNAVVSPDGSYSDAYSSNGSYTYASTGAQAFSLEESVTLSSLRFWGSSNQFNGLGLGNIAGFEIVIWNADFTSAISTTLIPTAAITSSATGSMNRFGGAEFLFELAIGGILGAGNYNINIGAQLIDGEGDQFVWSQGADTATYFIADGTPFGAWRPFPNGIEESPGGAFELQGGAIPGPGATVLLALASLMGITSRRRR